MVTCGFCGHEFEENRAQPACRVCPLGANCGLVRCPKCGYENPGVPRWIAFLRRKLTRHGPARRPAPANQVPLPMLGTLRGPHAGAGAFRNPGPSGAGAGSVDRALPGRAR
jgi:hypothetical protein